MAGRSRAPRATLRVATLVAALLPLGLPGPATAESPRAACRALPEDPPAMALTADWITGLQFATPGLPGHGALPIHHTPGFVDAAGTPYFDVVPYSANLAVTGLLRASMEGALETAEAWIRWVLAHLTTEGTVRTHWYRADGTGQTTCPLPGSAGLCDHEDAQDTTAGTFLGLVGAYHEAGGSARFLEESRAGLEAVADVLLRLQQGDGLTRETDRSPVRFLMNNSEAHWGLVSMARLAQTVFRDPAAARRYAGAAERLRQGIDRSLLDRPSGLYHVAKLEDGGIQAADLDTWFPGTVSLAWPHLLGVTGGPSRRARTQMAAINESWDGSPNPDWTAGEADPAGFRWPALARAAQLTGDCARARAHTGHVTAEVLPDFAWPWTLEDAGWLLQTLAGFAAEADPGRAGSAAASRGRGTAGGETR